MWIRTLVLSVLFVGETPAIAVEPPHTESCDTKVAAITVGMSAVPEPAAPLVAHQLPSRGLPQWGGETLAEPMSSLPSGRRLNGLAHPRALLLPNSKFGRGGAPSSARALAQCMQEVRLTASDGTANDLFGSSMAVDGDVAVIGVFQDDDAGPLAGSAYVFRFNGTNWVEEQKLTAPDASAFDYDLWFGRSVTVDGDTIVVGALAQVGDANGQLIAMFDSAYVFRFSGTRSLSE